MNEAPDIHAFPASKLGDFLRAMEDPEGSGDIDADRERQIARIERRLAAAADDGADDGGRPPSRPTD
jgi:hypothetical protein